MVGHVGLGKIHAPTFHKFPEALDVMLMFARRNRDNFFVA